MSDDMRDEGADKSIARLALMADSFSISFTRKDTEKRSGTLTIRGDLSVEMFDQFISILKLCRDTKAAESE